MDTTTEPNANYTMYKEELIPEPTEGEGPCAGLHLGHLPPRKALQGGMEAAQYRSISAVL